MQTPRPRWLSPLLLFLILLAGGPLAQAYYDPGIQQWINRDPIDEFGHGLLRSDRGENGVPFRSEEASLYRFVHNDAIDRFDQHGLLECGVCICVFTISPLGCGGECLCYTHQVPVWPPTFPPPGRGVYRQSMPHNPLNCIATALAGCTVYPCLRWWPDIHP